MSLFSFNKKPSPTVPWEQAVQMVRLLTIVCALMTAVLVAQGVAISTMLPLKEVRPLFYRFKDATENFVVMEKAGQDIQSNETLRSYFLRQYVINRETIDKMTEEIRSRTVKAFSSPEVYRFWYELYENKESSLYHNERIKERQVKVIVDSPLTEHIHRIELELTDIHTDGRIFKKTCVVDLAWKFTALKVAKSEMTLNPIGMIITKYKLTLKAKGN